MSKIVPNEVDEIPSSPSNESIYLIRSNGITDYTHGMFKYPCKFIPHIPRWFLRQYANHKTEKYGVLDPFCGSGTTLVESSILNYPSYGIDVDEFGKMLSQVKSTRYTQCELDVIGKIIEELKVKLRSQPVNRSKLQKCFPDFEGIQYWFSPNAMDELATIKYFIQMLCGELKAKVRNFFFIVFASIIRRASLAEEQSPKPYISKKIKKKKVSAIDLFVKALDKYFESIFEFSKKTKINGAKIIGYDARKIERKAIKSGKVHLAITSPPYINAFDYVRSLKLENIWLDLVKKKHIADLYDIQVGTEKISSARYGAASPKSDIALLNSKLKTIYGLDKKRAYVVADFFEAMQSNIEEVYSALIKGGHYAIVIGDSCIKNVHIPTSKILTKLAVARGFKLVNSFSYVIRNRYLRIPRNGRGGYIAHDDVIVFRK